MVRFIGLLAMGLFLIIGCGNNNSNTNSTVQEGKAGGTGIIVNISDGPNSISRPSYSWSNTTNVTDTTASRITVAPTSPNNAPPVWDVLDATLQDKINSPVEQGSTPQGSVQEVVNPELDLQSNVWYRVTVTKGDQTTNGFREFRIMQ